MGDAETPAQNLNVSALSLNTTLVPNANLFIGGTGAERTIRVIPAANKSGSAVIRVRVSDGPSEAFSSFTLNVTPVNDAPAITLISYVPTPPVNEAVVEG